MKKTNLVLYHKFLAVERKLREKKKRLLICLRTFQENYMRVFFFTGEMLITNRIINNLTVNS
jgi:hypothetical protein